MGRRTIVLVDRIGNAVGVARQEGAFVSLVCSMDVDACFVDDGSTCKEYEVKDNRFLVDVGAENAEYLLMHGSEPVLYGKSCAGGNMEGMIRRVERRKSAERAQVNYVAKVEPEAVCTEQEHDTKGCNTEASTEREYPHFYLSVKPALDEMFVCYPEEKRLNEMIPDSSWVSVTCADNSCYVVGLMRADGEVRYICYGVPSMSDLTPPDELASVCEWLPAEGESGYWVMFQDAMDGHTLTASER